MTTHPWLSFDTATAIATFSDYAEVEGVPTMEGYGMKFKATTGYASYADFDT